MMLSIIVFLINVFFGTPVMTEDNKGWDCMQDPADRYEMTCYEH